MTWKKLSIRARYNLKTIWKIENTDAPPVEQWASIEIEIKGKTKWKMFSSSIIDSSDKKLFRIKN